MFVIAEALYTPADPPPTVLDESSRRCGSARSI